MSQSIAERSAAAMWEKDSASQGLGIQIVEVAPGRAVLSMKVRPDMVNGLNVCHGGFIFTLADSAFAFACNSYNQLTFAHHCAVTFHAAGKPDDTLTATAQEVTRQGRSGLYDVMVHDSAGGLIASFRGHSRSVNGQHFTEDEA